jgi:fructokinase
MEDKIELLGIGNALVDIFTDVDDGVPETLGLPQFSQHVTPQEMGRLLERTTTGAVSARKSGIGSHSAAAGGGAGNTVKIAGLLGLKSAFIGAVGAAPAGVPPGGAVDGEAPALDTWGTFYKAAMEDAGVEARLKAVSSPTGLCLILRTAAGGETRAACPQASLLLEAADLDEALFERALAVALDGYLLGRDALVHRALDLAAKHGAPIALDIGSPFQASRSAREIERYCREYPLVLFMNEAESLAYYQALNPDQLDTEVFARRDIVLEHMADYFCRATAADIFPVIAVKRGERGSDVYAGGTIFRASTIALRSVETTGAGDAYCAGFMAGYIRGRTTKECAILGNKTARETIGSRGAVLDKKHFMQLAKTLV